MRSHSDLRAMLDSIPIIDTHEHFLPPASLARGELTLLKIFRNTYLGIDCVSAGMAEAWFQPGGVVQGPTSLENELEQDACGLDAVWPFLERTRNTAYHRAFLAGLRVLHGLDGPLDEDAWSHLAGKVQESYEHVDWFEAALDRLKITRVMNDTFFAVAEPPQWSTRVHHDFRVDDFLDHPWLHPHGGQPSAEIAMHWGVRLDTLRDLLTAIDIGFERYRSCGTLSVKIAVAYRRTLDFPSQSWNEAAGAFDRLREGDSQRDRLILGNYAVRHCIKRAIDYCLPVQIHTGMNYGHLEFSNPCLLVNLIQEFPAAKFVLFHGGYPYSDEAGLIAKSFPNVYLDLVWMPLLSVTMTTGTLERWLELVPGSKVMWGGDVWTVEECAGSVQLFKDALGRALWNGVQNSTLEWDQALDLAERIMNQNAAELYKIPSGPPSYGASR